MSLTIKLLTPFVTLCLLGVSDGLYCLGVDAQGAANTAKKKFELEIAQVNYPLSPKHESLQDPRATGYASLAFSPDGSLIAALTGTLDGKTTVTLWSIRTKKVEQRLSSPSAYAMKFLKSKDWLLIAGTDGKVRVWDHKKGVLLHTLTSPDKPLSGLPALDVASDGGSFVSVGRNLTLWDVATLKPTLVDLNITSGSEIPTGVAYAPDGKTFAYICGYGIRICDATTGRRLKEIGTGGLLHGHIAYHPDGRSFVTAQTGPGEKPGWVRLWNVDECKEITAANAFRGLTYQVGYTPDGKYLLAAGGNMPREPTAPLRIWEVATGKQVNAFVPVPSEIIQFAVSPDGKWLAASGEAAREVRLYEMKTLVGPAPPPTGPVPPVPPPPPPKKR